MRTRQLHVVNGQPPQKFLLRPVFSSGAAVAVDDFLTIGRDSSNTLQISDQFASSRHARIERKEDGRYLIRDLRSTNGTYVNGSRVIECFLNPGDRIGFGETEYMFCSEADDSKLELRSKNQEWAAQLAQVPHFAKTEFPVLIIGPSGTGKELLARSVHDYSTRSRGPFITVNCSALSESLVESELFGHVKGAFTGANNDRKGAFEAARGGTLFLDEIGDLPLQLQPKLLRALENFEIRPVGSDKIIKTDVRIVAATHQQLANKVTTGEFRGDLYFRLNVIRMKTPKLISRMEDFEDLVMFFCRSMRVRLSHPALVRLQEHSWPGNIRELKNVIARAASCYPGVTVQAEHLELLLDRTESAAVVAAKQPKRSGAPSLKDIERRAIIDRLVFHRGNQRRAAADLGLAKSTLHDRIKKYQINLPALLAPEDE
jgi:DNA-binding NtrC family response regulator